MRPPTPTWIQCWSHTLGRRVLAKVLGLVSAEDAGGLDRGSGTTGELLVEVDDALHAKGVRGSTNGLRPVSRQFFRSSVVLPVAILVLGPANNPSSRPSKAAAPDPSRRTRAARSPTDRRNSTEKTYLGGGDLGPTVSSHSNASNRRTAAYLGRDERRKRPAGDEAHVGKVRRALANWSRSRFERQRPKSQLLGARGGLNWGGWSSRKLSC